MKSNNKQISKKSMTDRVCKSASQVADQVSMGLERKKRIWESISAKLSEIDKRVLSWFLVMTTSFSLVVAGSIDFLLKETPIHKNEEETIDQPKLAEIDDVLEHKPEMKELRTIESKAISNRTKKNESSKISLPKVKITQATTADMNEAKDHFNKRPKAFAAVNINTNGLAPEIGLTLPVYGHLGKNSQHVVSVGLSTQIQMTNLTSSESSQASNLKIQPLVYGNLIYDLRKNDGAPNWNFRMGYQINESIDSSLWNGRSIKASIHKSLNDHIRIGPEIIISDDFKRVYPGIALVVS
ncbi:hypothetical protein [Reichenbachiella ulvae]|uniref:Outer membrane protein beta-barrel domain-containing protein n=1 Tax=Reichenbachiella ulvae TaxID=2980104 RepID=A0ABT3CRA3_9BACT|nr:hypothetical protein [Reichenbachiella ulvae]MCV9386147.1 hypothetical protein [Reichenbachiella ulvae]